MADGEQGAVAPEGDGKQTVLGGAPAGGEPSKLPELNGETWRLHLAGGDAELAKRFDRFTDPSALGKSLIEMEKRWSDPLTARLPQPLKENATDEEKAAHAKATREFYTKIGVPESADKYDIKLPEGFKPTADIEAGLNTIKAFGVEGGLTNAQVNGLAAKLIEWQGESDKAFEEQAKAAAQKNIEALKQQWGADYDTNLKLANATGSQFMGEAFNDFMQTPLADGTALGAHPVMAQFLATIGREFKGDPLFTAISGGTANLATVQSQIDAINALRDGTRAGNAAYDAKREELLKLIDLKRKLAA